MVNRLYITLGLLAAMTASVSSQMVRPVAPLGTPKTLTYTVEGQALISGKALDINEAPLPNANVRLRNLESRQIEQTSMANAVGEFTFVARPEIPYVVEIADNAGRVLAVGDIVIAQSGDVAAAIVSIPSRLPAVASVFSDTASSIVSAASGTGVTVVDPGPRLSPEQ